MDFILEQKQGFEKEKFIIPADTYPARCYQIIDLGTHEELDFNGNLKNIRKILFSFELPTLKRIFSPEKGEQPASINSYFTASLHEKSTLRKMLESWMGAALEINEKTMSAKVDFSNFLGKACFLNVVNVLKKDGTPTHKIGAITKAMTGFTIEELSNKPVLFSLTSQNVDYEQLSTFPEWLRLKIESSQEFVKILEK